MKPSVGFASSFGARIDLDMGQGPRSITGADLNGDGHVDLVLANEHAGSVSVLFGAGGDTFEPAVDYPVGNGPLSVATADLNVDGDFDLLVANSHDDSVSVLLNPGDGVFADKVDYPTGTGPVSIIGADLDGDGFTDLVLANSDGNSVSALLNLGDGTFATASDYVTGEVPASVISADLNLDGDIDLIVANAQAHTVSALLNLGDGSFAEKVDYATGTTPTSVTRADMNGDGYQDVVVANADADSVSILLNLGDGTFAEKLDYLAGAAPVHVASGDLNGDGYPDLALANYTTNRVTVLLNDGVGAIGTTHDYAMGFKPVSLAIGDLDGDGDADLSVAEDLGGAGVSVLRNMGDGTFSPRERHGHTLDYPSSVVGVDVDGDGDIDLAATARNSDVVSVFLNDGMGAFGARQDFATGSVPVWVASADLNADAHADLVVANFNDFSVSVLLGNGDGTFAAKVDYAIGGEANAISIADLDDDGDADLAVANSNVVQILLNLGDGAFADSQYITTGEHPKSITSADLDGDGDIDLAVADYANSTVSTLINDGNGVYSPGDDYETGMQPVSIISADFDADGYVDLAVANEQSDDVSVFINNLDSTYSSKVDYFLGATGLFPKALTSADLDGDGHIDLLVTVGVGDALTVLHNQGDGTFVLQQDYAMPGGQSAITTADLDADGDVDIAVANLSLDAIAVLRNGIAPPIYTEQTPLAFAANLLISDAAGDGEWDGGSLTVQITAHAEAADSLYLPDSDPGGEGIWLDTNGNRLMAGLTWIGTADAALASGGAAWTFSFNAQAGNALVQAAGRALLFNNSSDAPGVGARNIHLTATDRHGQSTSADISMSVIAVNDVPTLVGLPDSSVEVIAGVPLALNNITVADPDTANLTLTLTELNGSLAGLVDADAFSAGIQLSGTADAINAALAGASFTATAGGAAGIDFHLDDGAAPAVTASYSLIAYAAPPSISFPAFASKVDYAALSGPVSIVSADLDVDGDVDLAVGALLTSSLLVFLNNGEGAFPEQVNYGSWGGGTAGELIRADLDADGDTDLAVATGTTGRVSVYLNNGNGTFADRVDYGTSVHPAHLVSADLDGDGDMDLAATGVQPGVGFFVSVLHNNGNGIFAAGVNYAANSATSILSADLDGDGDADLATANSGSNTISVFHNNGNAIFAVRQDVVVGDIPSESPNDLLGADLDGDGDIDLGVAIGFNVLVLANSGTGTFVEVDVDGLHGRAKSLASNDLDGDGDADLAVTTGSGISILLNNGDGTFAFMESYSTGNDATSITDADLDSDGDPDLAVVNYQSSSLSVLRNIGPAAYTEQTPLAFASALNLTDAEGDGEWHGGSLALQIVLNSEAADTLYLPTVNPGGTGIWLNADGNRLMAGDVQIGTADAATASGNDLWVFAFNDQASNALVQATGRALLFNNASDNPSETDRIVRFIAIDRHGLNASAEKRITVTAVNDNPVLAANTGLALPEDAPQTSISSAMLNVADPEQGANALTFTLDSLPTLGVLKKDGLTLTLTSTFTQADIAAGRISYTPNADVNGSDGFGFTVSDGAGGSLSGQNFAITVTNANAAPTEDSNTGLTLTEDASATPITAAMLKMVDAEQGAPALSYTLDSTPTLGALRKDEHALTAGGSFTQADIDAGSISYTPNADAYGSDGFGFSVSDGAGGSLNGQRFAITITAVNDTPTLSASAATSTLVEAGGINNTVLGTNASLINFTKGDVDGTASFDIAHLIDNAWSASNGGTSYIKTGAYGTATFLPDFGMLSYALNNSLAATQALPQGQAVSETFTIQVTDGSASQTGNAVFHILGSNDAPALGGLPGDAQGVRVGIPAALADFTVTDADSGALTLTLTASNGSIDKLIDADGGSDGIQLTGTAADINTAIANATFTATAAGAASIGLSLSDGVALAVTATYALNASVNHAPVLHLPRTLLFDAPSFYGTGSNPRSLAAADVNGDGLSDLITANEGNDTVSVLLNNGNGAFAARTDYVTGAEPCSVAAADVNGDGKHDLMVANFASDTVSVLLNNGDGSFAAKTDHVTGNAPRSVATADVNGDGKPDLLVANQYSNSVSVLLNDGSGAFATRTDHAVGTQPVSVVAADLDGDGEPDLAVANSANYTFSVLLNSGNGSFATAVTYQTGWQPSSIAANDVNGDGLNDILTANNLGQYVDVLLNQGQGTFPYRTGHYTAGSPVSVAATDMNGDDMSELVVANTIAGIVSVSLNYGGAFPSRLNYSATAPSAATAADVNVDGLADLLAANVLGNTVTVWLNISALQYPAFTEQTPLAAAPTITLSDQDGNSDWNGGSLSVQITGNASAEDALTLATTDPGYGGIWLSGTNLMSGATQFATADATGVSGGTAWTFSFNGNATNARVQTLAQAVRFDNQSDSPNPLDRTVTFTATDTHGAAASIDQTVTVTAVNDSPTGAVFIAGVAGKGQTLSASNTVQDADGLGTISYQWQADGSDIPGATGASLTLGQEHVGKAISVVAHFTDALGQPESMASAATTAVIDPGQATPGNDTLIAQTTSDALAGGTGDDTYSVLARTNVITEFPDEGHDTVLAPLSWTLAANLENLTLLGNKKFSANGNNLDNTLIGNAAANILDGGTGADTLIGGAGNDVYVVENAGDTLQETGTDAGDSVRSWLDWTLGDNLENLTLLGTKNLDGSGNDLDNVLTGNGGNNSLYGGPGNDTLNGASGHDTLTGGAGADIFAFTTSLNSVRNIDTVTDFTSGTDKIQLSPAIFRELDFSGTPSTDAYFHAGNAAQDADDRILYDQNNGALAYDADGTGALAAVQFAVMNSAPALLYTDFVVG